MKTGDAAYVSGTVLYEDKGRFSVREADREPKRGEELNLSPTNCGKERTRERPDERREGRKKLFLQVLHGQIYIFPSLV